jgi:hypothetical protein
VKTTHEPKQAKPWYALFPWWGWILMIIASSQASVFLSNQMSGLIPEVLSAAFAFLMLFSIVALIVEVIVAIKNSGKRER